MRLLKIINPEKVDEKEISDWEQRKAARAVVFDEEGNIGLLYVRNRNYYKIAGGGVEEGEDIKTALDRECEEELGVEVEILDEVGEITEYRRRFVLKQTSYCFLAKANSKKKGANFTDQEKEKGFEVLWLKPEEALRMLSFNQTADYEGGFVEERDFCFLNSALEKIKFEGRTREGKR
ncbi:MAG: NUDIX domain-containing protein [Candidatus Pacebacteria bacterium]|nr:NUDIX domain-containing protein [Candidatus Paceibacterota bacterium]